MTVKKVEAFEYDGRFYKTEEDVRTQMARDALETAFAPKGRSNLWAWLTVLTEPRKAYEVLKEIYGDR